MLEEGKSDLFNDIAFLIEPADCDRLERYLNTHAARLTRGFIDCLFLGLCEKYQNHPEYENCINYLLL